MLQQHRIDSNTRIIEVGGVKDHSQDSGAYESGEFVHPPPDPWTIRQSRLMNQRVNINVGGERHQVRRGEGEMAGPKANNGSDRLRECDIDKGRTEERTLYLHAPINGRN